MDTADTVVDVKQRTNATSQGKKERDEQRNESVEISCKKMKWKWNL